MKILNESGIKKVIEYLNDDLKYVYHNDKHMILGNLTKESRSLLKDININLHTVDDSDLSKDLLSSNSFLYEAELDDVEVGEVDKIEAGNDDNISNNDVASMAEKMVPYLSKIFPTKDEINEVLNNMLSQMIDPDEMIDGLRHQIARIKRQSRETDEIG